MTNDPAMMRALLKRARILAEDLATETSGMAIIHAEAMVAALESMIRRVENEDHQSRSLSRSTSLQTSAESERYASTLNAASSGVDI
jgi:hypothetical protein